MLLSVSKQDAKATTSDRRKEVFMHMYTCRHAHEDIHTHSQSTSKMARTDLARSLASAARAVVTVGPILPNRARSALADNVVLLSLEEQKKSVYLYNYERNGYFNKVDLYF